MMFDLLVFTQHPKAYAPERFLEESKSLGLSLDIINYKRVGLKKLPDAKYVILREPDSKENLYDLRDKILKHYLSINSKILNSSSYLKWNVFDKLLQHEEFGRAGIPALKLLKLEDTEYPFIAKASLGSHGSHVFKIEKKEDLDRVLETHKLSDLLIQEFQTSGFDLRVIVLGGKVLGIMKRTPRRGEFLSNYSQGGGVEIYEDKDDKSIEEIAIKTADHFKLDYCGVDLMMGNDDEWKVLEVNRACQFQGFEKATKINVAKSVLEYMGSI